MALVDRFQRRFSYLRLSVTDKCNFSCTYCLPNGFQATSQEPDLSLPEILRLTKAFRELGVQKIRLTGGEPTVRRDILEIILEIKKTTGISKLALTTNGYRLKELSNPLRAAGLTQVNVSIDSLDRETFNQTTQTQKFDDVMQGIDEALSVGFQSVKINVVLLRQNRNLGPFLNWIKERPVEVRFIELMQTQSNLEYFKKEHISGQSIEAELLNSNWIKQIRAFDSGPASVYRNPEYQGAIGVIAPYSPGFCDSCNRLRVTSRGALRLCLFGDHDGSLRHLLQHDDQMGLLMRQIESSVLLKKETHLLAEQNSGVNKNFSQIGG